MPNIYKITDFEDERLLPYARLTEGQLRNRQDKQNGLFIAESNTVVTLALDAGVVPVSLLVREQLLENGAQNIIARVGDVPIYTASDEILFNITGFELSRGVIALMKRPFLSTPQEVCKNARRVAVLENIADSTNVGAIIRSAAALGMDAVLVTPSCSDPLLRRSARVSMGTVFQVPWTYIGKDAEDWKQNGNDILRELGFKTVAMALRADNVSIDDQRLKNENRLAIILGTEGKGLMPETIQAADFVAKIPMYHNVDSLNVAAASALAFWELSKNK